MCKFTAITVLSIRFSSAEYLQSYKCLDKVFKRENVGDLENALAPMAHCTINIYIFCVYTNKRNSRKKEKMAKTGSRKQTEIATALLDTWSINPLQVQHLVYKVYLDNNFHTTPHLGYRSPNFLISLGTTAI